MHWGPRLPAFCRQKSRAQSRKSWPASSLQLVGPKGSHVFAHIIRAVGDSLRRNSFVRRGKRRLRLTTSKCILIVGRRIVDACRLASLLS
jgi:hypothetical protein